MGTTNTLTPIGNALDSLEHLNSVLKESSKRGTLAGLKEVLVWGWHAVDVLTYVCLQPNQSLFDPWLQDYLQEGEPGLSVERDARWDERRHLGLLELLDMMSAEELSILKPEFYQGWQDRTSRCQNLRRQVAGILGDSIREEPRQKLLLLLAVYNRIFHMPAAVEIDVAEAWKALPALFDLLKLLAKSRPNLKPVLNEIAVSQKTL